jgi:hypothetical protein
MQRNNKTDNSAKGSFSSGLDQAQTFQNFESEKEIIPPKPDFIDTDIEVLRSRLLGNNTNNCVKNEQSTENQQSNFLENYQSETEFQELKKQLENRAELYRLRSYLRPVLKHPKPYSVVRTKYTNWLHRTTNCGRRKIRSNGGIEFVKGVKGSYYFGNLQKCGLKWLCPVCMAKLRTHHMEWLDATLKHYNEKGHTFKFVTYTFEHHKGNDLKKEIDYLIGAFRASYAHKTARSNRGPKGETVQYSYTLEITKGQNGWHPHLHIIYTHKDRETLEIFEGVVNRLYKKHILKTGKKFVSGITIDSKLVTDEKGISDYMTKKQALFELVSSFTKSTYKGGRNYLEMLQAMFNDGEDHMKDIHEYSAATYGRRSYQNSQKFVPEHLRQIEGMTDDEILQDDEIDEIILMLTDEQYEKLIKDHNEFNFIKIYLLQGREAAVKLI